MTRLLSTLFSFFLLFALINKAEANTIKLTHSNPYLTLQHTDFLYFVDDSAKKNINDILQLKEGSYKQPPSTSLGFQQAPHWFKLEIDSDIQLRNYIFNLTYPLLDYIQFYQFYDNKLISSYSSGDLHPFSNRPINYSAFAFPIDIPKGRTTIYLRIQTESALTFDAKIQEKQSFHTTHRKDKLIQGVFYGWMLIMLFYNFFLFVSTREISYLLMVGITAGNALMFLFFSGYGIEFIWTDALYWNQHGFIFTASLIAIFALLFTNTFFELKEHKLLFRTIAVSLCIAIIFLTLSLLLPYSVLIPWVAIYNILNTFLFLIIGILMTYRKKKQAPLYLIAWTFYWIGTILAAMRGFIDFLPSEFTSSHILQMGVALEVLLFSLALADKINSLRREVLQNDIVRLELSASLIQKHSKELEKKVDERTRELKEANKFKTELIAIVSHDLKNPLLNNIKGCEMLLNTKTDHTPTERQEITSSIYHSSQSMYKLVTELLSTNVVQNNQIELIKEKFDLLPLLNEVINESIILFKKQKIALDISSDCLEAFIYGDIDRTHQILQNLFSNMVQHLPKESKVVIRITKSPFVCLSITDNGKGLPNDIYQILTQPEENNPLLNRSKQLGLSIVRKFIYLNNWQLHVTTEKNKGTTFNIIFSPESTQREV